MILLPLLVLSVGLAMDAMAVSATKGFSAPRLRPAHVARMALLFGAFQGVMPVLGWAVGAHFATVIEAWDHWVAFALLSGIGAKMIHDARQAGASDEPDPHAESEASFAFAPLLVLAVATSIDALVAGLTLPTLGLPVALAATTIGVTTAALSASGAYMGRKLGARLGRKLDVLGGVLLIGLGVKILLEHTLLA